MQAVEIKVATHEQKPVMKWLLELYAEEFAHMKGERVPQKQAFVDSEYLDLYWKKPEWVPFLIFYHDKVAGFALVVSDGFSQTRGMVRILPEFFILKKYRRQGIGKLNVHHRSDDLRSFSVHMVFSSRVVEHYRG